MIDKLKAFYAGLDGQKKGMVKGAAIMLVIIVAVELFIL